MRKALNDPLQVALPGSPVGRLFNQDKNNIKRHKYLGFFFPEKFADDPFFPVPENGIAEPFRDGYAQPQFRRRQIVGGIKRRLELLSLFIYSLKVRPFPEMVLFCE